MAAYLLDTNHLGEALRPVSRVRDRIGQHRRQGIRIGTCVPVLCELEAGFPAGERAQSLHRALKRLLASIRLWPLERELAHGYAAIHQELRQRGRVLSQVDIMLAAMARGMNLTLATTDRDFEALPDIAAVNWLLESSREGSA